MEFTPELRRIREEAVHAVGRLDGVSRMMDPERLLCMYGRKEAVARESMQTALQLRGLFEEDRRKVARLGRAAGSALRVYELLKSSVLVSVPRAADELGLTWPTVNPAVRRLEALGIVHEVTGRARDRIYAYTELLEILHAGTEPGNRGE